MIFSGGTDERNAADVNIFNDFIIGYIGFGNGRFKGI